MILFRRCHNNDVNAIAQLAEQSGIGMTTLPKDRDLLQQRVSWACNSFEQNLTEPKSEYYLFVLEDCETQRIVGTSAIESATGYSAPFYSYKVSRRTRVCRSLGIRNDYDVLSLVNDNQGHSELCTLFLLPDYRVNGNGILLSRARFLYMALQPQRFASTVIAEMRGVSDDQGRSPFWDNVGHYFFKMSFEEADKLTLASDKQFIADLMPRNPVYVDLLSAEAQAVIGKAHPVTQAAMAILQREGFRYNHYVDIFDGGPTLEAPFDQINTIGNSQTLTIQSLSDSVGSLPYIISNTGPDFRATVANLVVNKDKNSCVLSKETAELLQCNQGECVRISPLYDHSDQGTS